MKSGNQRGFTVIELLVVIVVVVMICFAGILALAVSSGNFWYTEDGVLRSLKARDMVSQNATILETRRHVFDYTDIYVYEPSTDEKLVFYLDSDILFDYDFSRNK